MRVLVQLSDLHFGRTDPRLVETVIREVGELAPAVVVVSGDLTQRARPEQFAEARRFLDRLPQPKVVVPGNHDVPLYNLFARFFRRLDRYKSFITSDLEPTYED